MNIVSSADQEVHRRSVEGSIEEEDGEGRVLREEVREVEVRHPHGGPAHSYHRVRWNEQVQACENLSHSLPPLRSSLSSLSLSSFLAVGLCCFRQRHAPLEEEKPNRIKPSAKIAAPIMHVYRGPNLLCGLSVSFCRAHIGRLILNQ